MAQTPDAEDKKMGLTFVTSSTPKLNGLFAAGCGVDEGGRTLCNPYQGDKSCATPRPLLCIIDIDAPVPQGLTEPDNWTGSVASLTPPQRGERFATLKDANDYCAATFGEGWRVASFHDGGGWAMQSFGVTPTQTTSFWIDIKDQPKGTCWSR